MIDFNILKGTKSIEHTRNILSNNNSENITYFIEEYKGTLYLENFIENGENGYIKSNVDTTIISSGHSKSNTEFIQELFTDLDALIDLDFIEQESKNGSEIDLLALLGVRGTLFEKTK